MIIHALLLGAAFAARAKMLVVLENDRMKEQYSSVLNQLNGKFETHYKLADDAGNFETLDFGYSVVFFQIFIWSSTARISTKTRLSWLHPPSNLAAMSQRKPL